MPPQEDTTRSNTTALVNHLRWFGLGALLAGAAWGLLVGYWLWGMA